MNEEDNQAIIAIIGTVIHAYMLAGTAGMIVFLVELSALVPQGQYTPREVQALANLFLDNLASHQEGQMQHAGRRQERDGAYR